MGVCPSPGATVSIAQAVLRSRSTVLRERIDSGHALDGLFVVGLPPTTKEDTMNGFIAWIVAAQPMIGEHEDLEHVVRLAILADHFGVWALGNQALTLLDRSIQSGRWVLNPAAVDAIYRGVENGKPLRLLMANYAGLIVDQLATPTSTDDEDWKTTFMRHPALGWDVAKARERAASVSSGKVTELRQIYRRRVLVGTTTISTAAMM